MERTEFIQTPFGQKIQVPEMYAGKITKKEQDAAGNLKFYNGEKIIGGWNRLHGEYWEGTLIGRMIRDRDTGKIAKVSAKDWDMHIGVNGHYLAGYDLIDEYGNVIGAFSASCR